MIVFKVRTTTKTRDEIAQLLGIRKDKAILEEAISSFIRVAFEELTKNPNTTFIYKPNLMKFEKLPNS